MPWRFEEVKEVDDCGIGVAVAARGDGNSLFCSRPLLRKFMRKFDSVGKWFWEALEQLTKLGRWCAVSADLRLRRTLERRMKLVSLLLAYWSRSSLVVWFSCCFDDLNEEWWSEDPVDSKWFRELCMGSLDKDELEHELKFEAGSADKWCSLRFSSLFVSRCVPLNLLVKLPQRENGVFTSPLRPFM